MGRFADAITAVVPPWLRRVFGGKYVGGIGDAVDAAGQANANAIAARFPLSGADPAALAAIGTERRILRGPGEDPATYASRLRTWLDAHRNRGGPYELCRQFFLFWRATLDAPFEVVYASGQRFSVDASGNVTRDSIVWHPIGTGGAWAQYWIFMHVTQVVDLDVPLQTDDGSTTLDTDDGTAGLDTDSIDLSSFGGTLPDELAQQFASVPRAWSPAHVKRCTIVLLYGTGFVYGYPPGRVFGDGGIYGANPPAVIVVDF